MRSAPHLAHPPRRMSTTQRLLWTTTGLVGSILGANNVAFAQILPTAGDVVSTAFSGGNAPTITNPTVTSLSVALDAKATVINWKSFSIPDANTGDFNTARADQITVLNRVVGDGGAPLVSQILGSLTAAANISVFLVNPSGVTFGPNGNYSGGSLVLSTLDIGDADFLDADGNYKFTGSSTAAIALTAGGGSISTTGAPIVVIGQDITSGKALSAGDDVAFVAATDVDVALNPGSPLSVKINVGTTLGTAKINASGTISGDSVIMAGAGTTVGNLLNVDSGAMLTATAVDGRVIIAAGGVAQNVAPDVGIAGVTFDAALAGAGESASFAGSVAGTSEFVARTAGAFTATATSAINTTVGAVAIVAGGVATSAGNISIDADYTLSGASVVLGLAGGTSTQTTKGGIVITATDAGVTGKVTGLGTLSLTSNSDATGNEGLSINGIGGGIDLGAASSLIGSTTAGNESPVTLNAGTKAINFASATADVVTLTTSGNITSTGSIASNLGFTVSTAGAVSVNNVQVTNAAQDISLTSSAGAVSASGTLVAPRDVAVSAAAAATVSGAVTAGRDYIVTGSTGVVLGGATSLAQMAAGAVTITATTGDVTQGAGFVTLKSNSDAVGTEALSITATSGSILLGTSGLIGGSTTNRESNVSLSASSGSVLSNEVDANSLTVVAGTDITSAKITTTQAISLTTAVGSIGVYDLETKGAGAAITINSAGTAEVAGSVKSLGDYSVTGATGVMLGNGGAATQMATGAVTINATGGNVTQNSGALTLQSNSDLIGGEALSVTSAASNILLGTAALIGGSVAGRESNVTLSAPVGNVTFGTADANVFSITSGTGISATNKITARTGIILTTTAGDINVVDLETVGAGGSITVNSAALAAVSGNVTSLGDYVVSGASVTLGSAGAVLQQATGKADITSTAGAISGTTGLTLTANSDGAGTEALTLDASGSAINFASGSTLNGGPAKQSKIGIRFGTAGQTLTLGNVNALSLEGVQADHTTFAGLLNLSGGVTLGAVSLTNTLDLTTTGSITSGAIAVSAGNAMLTAGGAVTGTTVNAAAVTVGATTGNILLDSVTATAGKAMLSATAGNVMVDSVSATGGDAVISAGNAVSGRLPTNEMAISAVGAGSDISVTTTTAGAGLSSLSAGGNIDLSTGSNVTVSGNGTAGATDAGSHYFITGGTGIGLGGAVPTTQMATGEVKFTATTGNITQGASAVTIKSNSDVTGSEALTLLASAGNIVLGTTDLIGGSVAGRESAVSFTSTNGSTLINKADGTTITGTTTGATGSLTANAALTATGAITLNAAQAITGPSATGASISATALGGIALNVTNATGANSLMAGDGITGMSATGATLTATTSANNITLTNATATGGAAMLTATAGNVMIDSVNATGGDVTIVAGNAVTGRLATNEMAISASGAGSDISVTTTTAGAGLSSLSAGGNIDLSTGSNVTVSGNATAGATDAGSHYFITGGTGIGLGGAVTTTQQATGEVKFTATTGSITQGAGALTIKSNSDVTGTEALNVVATTGNIALANTSLIGGSLSGRESDVSLSATVGSIALAAADAKAFSANAGANITASGKITSTDPISLATSAGNIAVTDMETKGAGSGVTVNASGLATVSGDVTSLGDYMITGGTGVVLGGAAAKTQQATGLVSISATTGNVDQGAGLITVKSNSDVTGTEALSITSTAGNIALGNSSLIGGSIAGRESDVTLSAPTGNVAFDQVDAKVFTVTAGAGLTSTRKITAREAISLTTTAGTIAVADLETTNTGAGITVNSAALATVTGNVTSLGDYVVTGATGVVLGGATAKTQQATGLVSISATTGDVRQGTGRITVKSNSDVTGTEALSITSTAGNITLGNSSLIGGSVAGRESAVTLSASTGSASFSSVDAKSINVTVGTDIVSNGKITTTDPLALTTTAGNITVTDLETKGAGSNITINSSALATVAGDVTSLGDYMVIGGAGAVLGDAAARTQQATGLVAITATTGNISQGPGLITVKSNSDVTGAEGLSITASTGSIIFARSSLIGGSTTGRESDVTLSTPTGNIAFDRIDAKVFTATAGAGLSTINKIIAREAINLTTTGGSISVVDLETTNAGAGITVNSAALATVAGDVTSLGEYRVTGATSVTLGGMGPKAQKATGLVAITATSGAVGQGSGLLTLQSNSDVAGTESLSVTAAAGIVLLTNTSLIGGSSGGRESDVSVSVTGGPLLLGGPGSFGKSVSITKNDPGGDLRLSGDITASDDLTVTSGSDILIGETNTLSSSAGNIMLTAADSVYGISGPKALPANNGADRIGTLTTVGDLTLVSAGDIRARELTSNTGAVSVTTSGSLTGLALVGDAGDGVSGGSLVATAAGKGVTVNAGIGATNIARLSSISGGASVSVTAGGIAVGTTSSNGTLALDAKVGSLYLGIANAVTATLNSTPTIDLTTPLFAASPAIAIDTRFGGTKINAATSATVGGVSGLLRQFDTITASGLIDVKGKAFSANGLTSSGGALAIVADDGGLYLGSGSAGTTATLTKNSSTPATASDDDELRVGSLGAQGNADVSSATNARLASITSATGAITVNATRNATGTSLNAGGDVSVSAGPLVDFATLTAVGLVAAIGDKVAVGTASAGSLTLTARTDQLSLTTGRIVGTAFLTKSGAMGETSVTDLITGGNATINSSTNVRLASVKSTAGSITATAAGDATGTILDANQNTSVSASGLVDFETLKAGNSVAASGGTVLVRSAEAVLGSLSVQANGGQLTLGSGSAGTTASLSKTGTDGELMVTTLMSGGDATITSDTSARLGSVSTTSGNIDVTTVLDATGLTPTARAELSSGGATKRVHVRAGDEALLGAVGAAGLIDIRGASVDVSTATAGTSAMITATTGALIGGAVTTGGGAATLTATLGSATIGTISTTGGNASVTAGALAKVNGAVSAGGDYLVTGGTGVMLGGAGAVTQMATGLVSVNATNGDVTQDSGVLTLKAGSALTVTAIGTASGDVALSNTILMGDSVTVTAKSMNIGTANATNALSLTAQTGQLTLGTGTAGTTADLTKTGSIGELMVTTLNSGGNGTIRSATNTRLGTMTSSGGNVSVTAGLGGVTGDVTGLAGVGDGPLPAFGRATLTASAVDKSVSVLTAPGTAQLGAVTAGAGTRTPTAPTAQVSVQAKAIDITSAEAKNGGILLAASGGILTVGTSVTAASSVAFVASGDLTLSNITAGEDIGIKSGGNAVVMNVTAADDIVAQVTGTSSLTNAVSQGAGMDDSHHDFTSPTLAVVAGDADLLRSNIVVDGTGAVSLTTVNAKATLAARSVGAITGTGLTAGEDIAIKSGGTTNLTTATAGDDIDATAAGDATLTGGTTTGLGLDNRRVSFADATRISFGAETLGSSNIAIDTGAAATVNMLDAKNSIAVRAVGAITSTTALKAGEDIATSSGGLTILADANAGDDIDITATGNATLTKGVTTGLGADTRRLAFVGAQIGFGGETLTASNIAVKTAANAQLDLATAINSIAVQASGAVNGTILTAGEDIAISSVGATTLTTATAGDDLLVMAGGNVALGAGMTTGAGADNSSVAFATPIMISATVAGNPKRSDIMIDAGGDVNVTTSATAASTLTARSGGAFTAATLSAGEDIGILTGTSVSITAASAGDDLEILAGTSARVTSATARGTGADNRKLTLANPIVISTGENTDRSGSNIIVDAGTNVTLTAASAKNSIGARARAGDFVSGTMLSADEDIGIFSGGLTNIAKAVAGDDVDITATSNATLTDGTTSGLAIDTRRVSFADANRVSFGAETLSASNIAVKTAGDAKVDLATAKTSIAIQAGGSIAGTTLTAGEDIATLSGGATNLTTATAGDDLLVSAGGNVTVITGSTTGAGADNNSVSFGTPITIAAAAPGSPKRSDIAVDGGSNVSLGSLTAVSTLTARAGADLTATTIRAGEDVGVMSGGSTVITTATAGDDLIVKAGTSATLSTATSAGTGPDDRKLVFGAPITIAAGEDAPAFTGSNIDITGASVGVTTANAAAAIRLLASSGQLTIDTGSAATTATLTKTGTADEIKVTTLTSGLASLITSQTNARIGSVAAANGRVDVTSTNGATTGLLGTTPVGLVDTGFGRANLSAAGGTNGVKVTAGTLAQLGIVSAAGSIDVGAQRIDVATATATTGALTLNATLGELYLDQGSAGTTATLNKTGDQGELRVTTALTSGGTATINSSTNARLASVKTTGGNIAIAAVGEATGTTLDAAADATITAGPLVQFSAIKAGSNVSASGDAVLAGSATATAGALTILARSGQMTLGTGTAGTTATLTKTGATGEITVTSLTSGAASMITSQTNARLGTVSATNGRVDITSTSGATTGLLGATPAGLIDPGFGRANLSAGGGTNGLKVTAGTLAQLGTVSAAGAVEVGAQRIDVTKATATAGLLDLNAGMGELFLDQGSAGTTAKLTKTGDQSEIQVTTSLASVGNATIASNTNARLKAVTTSGGDLKVTSTLATTGIAVASVGTSDPAFGRGDLSAAGAGKSVMVTSGALSQLGTVVAGRDITVAAGNATRNGAIDVTNATASAGALTLTARATTPIIGTVNDGDIILDTGKAGTTATLSNTDTAGANGNAGNVVVATSLFTGADININSKGNASLGVITAATGPIKVTTGQIALNGKLSVAATNTVTLTNRADVANITALGDAPADANAFALSDAELDLISAPNLVIDSGVKNLAIGTLSLATATGSESLRLLAHDASAITLTGVVSQTEAASPARKLQIGGSANPMPNLADGDLASTLFASTNPTTGGRVLLPSASVELRAKRIIFGLPSLISETRLQTPALIALNFVSRPNSSLYNSIGGYAQTDAGQQILRADSLTLRYTDFALFQNTAPAGLNAGVVLGPNNFLANAPARLTLYSRGDTPLNSIGIFGTINGFTGNAAGLLPNSVVAFSENASGAVVVRITRSASRLNGCAIGAPEQGCLTTQSPPPILRLFDERQALIFRTADDSVLPFDPLIGTNNEALFIDIGGVSLPYDDSECGPDGAGGANCAAPGEKK